MNLRDIFANLSPQEQGAFRGIMQEKTFAKSDILIGEGQVATSMYYLMRGACRSFFYKDGEDITDFFFFDHEFASDFASFYSGKPSLLNLEALEDTVVFEIRREDLLRLYQQSPGLASYGRITAEYAFLLIEERMRLLHSESLETRYRWLLDRFPAIFQRVPQYQIASYLGVKPESLSRIQKQIGTGDNS